MRVMLTVLAAASLLAACSKMPVPPAAPAASGEAAPVPAESPVTIASWGPQGTDCGQPANPTPQGDTGLFFNLSRSVAGEAVSVLADSRELGGVATADKLVTAILPKEMFATQGSHPIVLRLTSQEIKVGTFEVTAGAQGCPAK